MKIHGTAKGGALSKKDFGVAFGAPPVPDPVYETDFSTDTGWTLDTDMSISGGKLRAVSLDLEEDFRASHTVNVTLSDSEWYCRFQLNVANCTLGRAFAPFAITDTTGVIQSGDAVYFYWHDVSGTPRVEVYAYEGGSQDSFSTGGNLAYATDYWGDFARTTTTNVRLRIYSDADYSTQVGSDLNLTISSSIISLSLVQSGSSVSGNAGDKANYTMEDIKIWNEVTEKP